MPGAVKATFKLREDADTSDLSFQFPYADAARESYAAFTALKREGVIPASTRFQFSIPTVVALNMYFAPEDAPIVIPAIERALLSEVNAIVSTIPHDQLAIQFDVAAEIAVVEGYLPNLYGDDLAAVYEMTAQLGAAVPDDVQLGFHLCYGDEPGEDGLGSHFQEPADTSKLVTYANEICRRAPRHVSWIHMPVPIDRDDDAYFAPLAGLDLTPGTELYLGLVHREDGIEGAQRRADAAAKYVKGFGVATECGMGREPQDAIEGLLRTHTEVVVPV